MERLKEESSGLRVRSSWLKSWLYSVPSLGLSASLTNPLSLKLVTYILNVFSGILVSAQFCPRVSWGRREGRVSREVVAVALSGDGGSSSGTCPPADAVLSAMRDSSAPA